MSRINVVPLKRASKVERLRDKYNCKISIFAKYISYIGKFVFRSPHKTYFLLILTNLVFGLFGVRNLGFGKFLVKAPLDRLFRMARLGRGSNEVRVCNESVM